MTDYRVKIKESEKIDKYLEFARELKKNGVNHEDDDDTNCNWYTWDDPKRLWRKTEGIGNQRKNWHHPDLSLVEIN